MFKILGLFALTKVQVAQLCGLKDDLQTECGVEMSWDCPFATNFATVLKGRHFDNKFFWRSQNTGKGWGEPKPTSVFVFLPFLDLCLHKVSAMTWEALSFEDYCNRFGKAPKCCFVVEPPQVSEIEPNEQAFQNSRAIRYLFVICIFNYSMYTSGF